MTQFRTKYTRIESKSETGSPIRAIYGSKLDKNNNVIVEKKGEESMYDYIQSFKDSVDINVVLQKFANGDDRALNQREAFFLDIADMPNNVNEFVEFTRNANALFDSLPVDIKESYGNNVYNFMESVATGEYFKEKEKEIMKPLDELMEKPVEPIKVDVEKGEKVSE